MAKQAELSRVHTQPLPGLNMVVVLPDQKAWAAMIRAVEAASGIKPEQYNKTDSATRAHYAPAASKVILNYASERMHQLLGRHVAVIALEIEGDADDRRAAALRAHGELLELGYAVRIDEHAEPEFPDGFIIFVSSPNLGGVVLMIWPKFTAENPPPPGLIEELPKRLPWDDMFLK